jgi:hypothetical protein
MVFAVCLCAATAASAATSCGDGVCGADETCKSCRRDCGSCAPAVPPAPAATAPRAPSPAPQETGAAGETPITNAPATAVAIFGKHDTAGNIVKRAAARAMAWFDALDPKHKAGLAGIILIAAIVLWKWIKKRRDEW